MRLVRRLARLVKPLIPPLIYRAATSTYLAVERRRMTPDQVGEQDADWYDKMYQYSEGYRQHYTESEYFFIWSVLADRVVRSGCRSVLDIGCGSGQLAALMLDRGVTRYCGLDLSKRAIAIAQKACPTGRFVAGSVFETDLFEAVDYDVIVTTEMLEHLNEDMQALQRMPKGKRILATVPNFPHDAHVRYFADAAEVFQRYSPLFEDLRVDTYLANTKGKMYFLMDGHRC